LDTRSKILASAAGLNVETLVIGYFDPVTAEHAARLAELGGGLTVAIVDPPEPLLPARARAELVAALRGVERVIVGDPRPSLVARRVVDETEAHLAARARLVGRIVSA